MYSLLNQSLTAVMYSSLSIHQPSSFTNLSLHRLSSSLWIDSTDFVWTICRPFLLSISDFVFSFFITLFLFFFWFLVADVYTETVQVRRTLTSSP